MVVLEKLAPLAGAGLFLLPGAALVQLLPALRALPLGPRLAYTYLLGVAWVAGGLYVLSHTFAVPLRPPTTLALAAAPVFPWLALLARRRRAGLAHPTHLPRPAVGRWTGLEITALAMAGLVFAAVLADAVTFPLRDWDGRMFWATQAAICAPKARWSRGRSPSATGM